MSLINGKIGKQNFELIGVQLGAILTDEVKNQSVLHDDSDLDASVWYERFVPLHHTEMPSVNVALARGSYAGQTVIQTDGKYTYHIDVHTSSLAQDGKDADGIAMAKLQRLLGICRAIIEDPKYKTLGFAAPRIKSRHVTEIIIAEPDADDTASCVRGRLLVVVEAPENHELLTPVLIGGNDTVVKLEETEKGYKYIFNN